MNFELERLILIVAGLPNLTISRRAAGEDLVIRSRENRNLVGDRSFQGALLGTGNRNYAPTMRWVVSTLLDQDEVLLFEQYARLAQVTPSTAFTLEDRVRRMPTAFGGDHNRQAIAGTLRTSSLSYTESYYRFSVRLDIKDDDYVRRRGGNIFQVNFQLAEIALPQ